MKINYSPAPRDPNDAVAYIDRDGDIRFKTRNKGHAGLSDLFEGPARVLFTGDTTIGQWGYNWEPENPENKAVFYPGDMITLTF